MFLKQTIQLIVQDDLEVLKMLKWSLGRGNESEADAVHVWLNRRVKKFTFWNFLIDYEQIFADGMRSSACSNLKEQYSK